MATVADIRRAVVRLLSTDEAKIAQKQISNPRIEDDEVVALVDYGAKGTKKHRFPLDILNGPEPEEA